MIFTTIRSQPDLQFQGAGAFFHIVMKQTVLYELNGLDVRVFP